MKDIIKTIIQTEFKEIYYKKGFIVVDELINMINKEKENVNELTLEMLKFIKPMIKKEHIHQYNEIVFKTISSTFNDLYIIN